VNNDIVVFGRAVYSRIELISLFMTLKHLLNWTESSLSWMMTLLSFKNYFRSLHH